MKATSKKKKKYVDGMEKRMDSKELQQINLKQVQIEETMKSE